MLWVVFILLHFHSGMDGDGSDGFTEMKPSENCDIDAETILKSFWILTEN